MLAPKVSVIVTTYEEKNHRYLDLCIKSVRNLNYPQDRLEIIIVSKSSYIPRYDGIKTIFPSAEEFPNPKGMNIGFHEASKDSKYFFYMNDDVILAKDCLSSLISVVGDQMVMANPISPCDNGVFYQFNFGFKHGSEWFGMTGKFFRYEQLEPHFEDLMNTPSPLQPGWIKVPWLCMFTTLVPRKVWEAIGDFDEKFETGQDDIDYCNRAAQNGVSLLVATHALSWHFGGVTSTDTIKSNKRYTNIMYYKEKWGCLPPFVTEASLEHFKNGKEWDNNFRSEGAEARS